MKSKYPKRKKGKGGLWKYFIGVQKFKGKNIPRYDYKRTKKNSFDL